MFNKEEYWARRRKGLRGQVPHSPIVATYSPREWADKKEAERAAKRGKGILV